MRTPSLGRRVVVGGVAVVTALGLCLDILLYVSLRSNLLAEVDRDLARGSALVVGEAAHTDAEELPDRLADRLADLGAQVTLRAPSGRAIPRNAPEPFSGEPVVTRPFRLAGGYTGEVAVSRASTDRALGRLLRLEAMITPLALVLALLLLRLIAEIALRPLDRIALAARRTSAGHRGERLRPQPPDTRLGQMAMAYDDMLDALETAVRDAEAANAETEQLLERNRRILDTAREAFVAVDEGGIVIDWNAEAERIFGWPRHEAIGRPVAGTVVATERPEEGGNGLEHFEVREEVERTDRVVNITAVRHDGHRFPARMTVWTTRHGGRQTVSAFIWDVTEQLRIEKALAQLAAVVESADDAMYSIDLDGSILTWNAAAERMFGYTPSEVIGRHIHLLVPDALHEEADLYLAAALRGDGVQRVETLRQCRSGLPLEVALTISPVRDATGTVCAASSVARDITEERWISAQLDHSLRALESALDEAKTSEAETRRFLDDASHQLRAPITSIRACAEGLLRTNDPTVRDELLGAVVRETSRAGRLMTGLLRLARLNHGKALIPVPCDVLQLCRDQAVRAEALSPGVRVTVSESGALPLGLPMLDSDAVTEIVSNLLENARRHATSRIDIAVSRDEGWVEIELADDGPGLPDAMVDSAFDRFVSLDGKGGSGLGLPIARELAQAQGGDLHYLGKSFVVRLPRVGRDASALAGGSAAAPAGRSEDESRPRPLGSR